MQLNKVRHIELFGVSGSGKTYIRNEIKDTLKKDSLKILDNRELIILKYDSVIKLNFIEKQIINYFKVLNFIKKNFKISNNKKILTKKKNYNKNYSKNLNELTVKFKDKYEDICKKILLKNKKCKKIYKFVLKILKKSKDPNKTQYHFWFVEMLAANCIFEKVKAKSNFIYFPDEGLVQRVFLINHLSGSNNAGEINEYLKIIFKADLILNINSSIKEIYDTHFKRKASSNEFRIDRMEINKMVKFKKKFIKVYANFKFINIQNNEYLKRNLNNRFNS